MEEKEIFFFDFYYSIFPVFISNKQKRERKFMYKYFQLKKRSSHTSVYTHTPSAVLPVYVIYKTKQPTSGSPAF
jgi:hypothetical protein